MPVLDSQVQNKHYGIADHNVHRITNINFTCIDSYLKHELVENKIKY